VYFGALALAFGFFFAIAVALAKSSRRRIIRKPAEWFVFIFRGSPLFIQFFLAYETLQLLPKAGIDVFGITVETAWTTRAWAGALFVLFLNTSAYAAEIFYGALRSIPKGDLEAAEAYGLTGWQKFRRIQWPTMLRLAWPVLHERGDLPVPRHDAGVLFRFPGLPADGRCALLRQLLRRQDLQPLRALSHRCRLFHLPDPAADLGCSEW
jgi:His/Glu/Gln/Arg/opine family amino acid ABC transporter permease subunit